MSTLVAGGTVVTAASTYEADVLVDGGQIVRIGRDLDVPGAERIDASGKFVFPGALDVHTHLETPWGDAYVTADDWRAGTVGAACGGTTTVVDFALQAKGQTLRQAIDGWHAS